MRYFAYTLVAIAILNFALFVIVAVSLGGDAVNGKEEAGRTYVGAHGHYTEVSRSVFEYSRLHARGVWVTHPLALLGGLLLYREEQKRKAKSAA
jgi:hypothetical protein